MTDILNITHINFTTEALKSLGGGRVGGYLVRYSDETMPDLTGDFFTQATDYGIEPPARIPAYFHHGQDSHKKRLNSRFMDVKADDIGLWAEAILDERDKYEAFLLEMAKAGKLGLSSGAAPHLYEAEPKGNANWIKTWVIAEGSITHMPAEPRNTVIPLKSLGDYLPQIEPPEVTGDDGADNVTASTTDTNNNLEGATMSDTNLITMSREDLAAVVKGTLDEYTKSLPVVNATQAQVQVIADEADQPFATPGEYFKAVQSAAMYPASEDRRLRPLKVKASGLSEGVPADGGYLVPPAMAGGIIERMLGEGRILSRVSMDQVAGNSMTYNGVNETTRVGSVFGGITTYWLGEAATKTASKPAFYQLELKLKKVAAVCYATDELLDDAAALQSWLMRNVPSALIFAAENAIINGDGVGKPSGILASACVVNPLRTGANLVDAADVASLWSRRYVGVNDYVWLINPGVGAQLNQLVIAGAYSPVYLPPGGYSAAPYGTLFGRPVIETEYMPALGTTGDITLASLSQYQAISKGGVQSATSIHVQFLTDETAFRFVYRIDGAPLWASALTPLNGSTVSPFVALSSASA